MADRIKGITVEIGGDTTGLSKALSGVNKEIKSTQSQLKDVNKLLKLDPTNTTLLEQKQKLLQQAVSETKEKLTQLKSVQDQMDAGLKNGTVTQQQYDAWQREIIETENELKNLEQQCRETDTSITATLRATGSKLQEVGGKISDVGTSLSTHVTAPIVAIGAASIAAFNEVDAGLDIVAQKTGATGDELEDMCQIVKDLATEIPTDFETAGAAVGEVNTRFGLTGQALDDLSAKFIKFAQLNDTDVSTSIDNVSSVMNAFGMDASEADNLLDALNATGQATGIDMDTLANALSSNAAQLKEMGLTAQQAAGFMGMVEMSGLDTSAAMMGLKTAMKNATADGKTLDQVLAEFSTTMQGSGSDAEKLQAAYDLFGSKAGASIYNAVQTGKLNLSDFSGFLGDFEGSVENTFNETLDPIDQFQMTMNSLKETGAEVGNSLMSVLAPVLKELSDKLKSLAEWWNNLGEPMQQMIVKIALVAAAIGPVLVIVGKGYIRCWYHYDDYSYCYHCYGRSKDGDGWSECCHGGKSDRPDHYGHRPAGSCVYLPVEQLRGLQRILDQPLGKGQGDRHYCMDGDQGLLRQCLGGNKEHLHHCGKCNQQFSYHSLEYDKKHGRNRDECHKDGYLYDLEWHQELF